MNSVSSREATDFSCCKTLFAHSLISAVRILLSVCSYGSISFSNANSPYFADRIYISSGLRLFAYLILSLKSLLTYKSFAFARCGSFWLTQETRTILFLIASLYRANEKLSRSGPRRPRSALAAVWRFLICFATIDTYLNAHV